MRAFLTGAAAFALLAACAGTPQAGTAQQDAANKKVCRSVKVVGSGIPERICATQAEWENAEREDGRAREMSRELDKRGTRNPNYPEL